MNVVLVQCPVWGTREPPLGIVQLAGCMKSRGYEVFSFDLNNYLYRNRQESFKNLWAWEQSLFWYRREEVQRFFREITPTLEQCIATLLSHRPDVVGFSVAASSYESSVAFAGMLRKAAPSVRIIFGGSVYHNPDYIAATFADAPVDFVIKGEADVSFPELVACLESKQDPSHCPGVYFKNNGAITFSGERPLLAQLDVLPFMDFTDLRIEDYDDAQHISIMSSRGCVWHCAFCSSCAFWQGYRTMSAERIHQEITFHRLMHPGIGHIDFADLVFNGDTDKIDEFAHLMTDYPPYDPHFKIQWNANAVISPHLTPGVLQRLKLAGCQRLFFGIESGSERVLKLMHKPYKPEVAVGVIRAAHEAGIRTTCNFMFGFPGETEDDFNKSLAFVESIAGFVDRVYPSRTYCAIEQYSYFHEHPESFGIKTPVNHHLYWESIDGTNTYPVRLERCRRFEERCQELGVTIDCGVRTSVELDNWFSLGMYYEYKQDIDKMMECYRQYLALDPQNKVVRERVLALLQQPAVKLRWGKAFPAIS